MRMNLLAYNFQTKSGQFHVTDSIRYGLSYYPVSRTYFV